MGQKRYTTWGTPYFPVIETRELGHADTLEDARDIAAGCEIAFVYDHELGNNVDSMVSAAYKKRIGGVWIDDYSGWRSQWSNVPQAPRPSLLHRLLRMC